MSGIPRRARLTEAPGAPPVTVLRARRPDLHVPAVARARLAGAGEVSDGSPRPPKGSVPPGLERHRRTRLRRAGWGCSSSAMTTETELGSIRREALIDEAAGATVATVQCAGCRARADGCPRRRWMEAFETRADVRSPAELTQTWARRKVGGGERRLLLICLPRR
jgi:hypothetical protein